MDARVRRYGPYALGGLALVGGYLYWRSRQAAASPVTSGSTGAPSGPGYPFVTGAGGPGVTGLITCPDGSIVSDSSQCPGSGTGQAACGQVSQACCSAAPACNSGLNCLSGLCQQGCPATVGVPCGSPGQVCCTVPGNSTGVCGLHSTCVNCKCVKATSTSSSAGTAAAATSPFGATS